MFADYSEQREDMGDLIVGIVIAVVKCRRCGMLNLFNFRLEEDEFERHMLAGEMDKYIEDYPDACRAL
jgi:hypothetical protein